MTCSFDAYRGADRLRAYTFPAGTNFAGYSAALHVYAGRGGPTLLSVTGAPTPAGSAVSLVAGVVSVLLDQADIVGLPAAAEASSPALLAFDLVLTDGQGLTTRLDGGLFRVWPLGAAFCEQLDVVTVNLGAEDVTVEIFSGPSFSLNGTVSAFGADLIASADAAVARADLDVYSRSEVFTRALAVNEAANSKLQVIPDLPEIRKLVIGAGGVPTGALRPARTCNSITASSNTPTLGFTVAHDFRVGELIRAPAGVHANLLFCTLEVLSVPTPMTLTVKLPRGFTVPLSTSANGDWVVVTRGDDGTVDVTGDGIPDRFGDLMSGDDQGKWQKNATLYAWLEDHPNLLALFPGAERVWLVRKGDTAGERIFFNLNVQDRAAYVGKRRAVGMAVVRLSGTGAATASIIQNGVASAGTSSVGGARSWIGHSAVVTGTSLLYADGVIFTGAIGDYFAVAEFVRREGQPPQDGEYAHRIGWVRPQGSITAVTMNGATLTFPAAADVNGHYSYEVNLYQESNGRLGPSVKSIFWNLEGVGYVKGQVMATKEIASTTTTYGHVVTALGATLGCTISSNWDDADGAGPGVGVVTATVTTEEPHGLITGQTVIQTGAQQAGFDGQFIVTVTGDSTYTYTFNSASNPFGSNPGTVTTATALKARLGYYAASRCDLNLNNHRFYLYSVWPSQSWRAVSMDINRRLA